MSETPVTSYPTITPYSHPTTVVFVDDNDLFLHSLDLRMPAEMAYLCFHNPRHALERVNEKLTLAPIPERCFSTPAHSLHWSDSVIRFDLGLIEQEINNMQRFRRTSVVIADFAMPAIDGLSLLTSIRDPSVKTVLMSGAGDEKLALEAFNDGLIDRYIPKNRSTTLDMVVDYAQELQREYFLEQQRAIQESLSLNPPDLLEDPVVSKYFAALRKKHGFVEHYLVGDPPGFVFVTAKGALQRLIVLSDAEVTEQVEYAARNDAPTDVVEALASRSRVGFFYELAENYGDEPYPWRDFLYEPTSLGGAKGWWAALISDPPTDIDFSPVECSFNAYLDEIDAVL
jgi:CheY-like chemotaxis protein